MSEATSMAHDLLAEPLLSVEAGPDRRGCSLPEVLALLGAGQPLEFRALRPHQQHAWHAFLVQLAALVAHREGGSAKDPGLRMDADAWRESLLDLVGSAGPAAWYLVVEDLALPAFLQPPVPEGTLAPYKKEIPTPDELDVVVTTRNHDVKQERMAQPAPEHWIYALISLQTMEGFLGRGNYGIARMNGGFSNRPYLSMASGRGWAERFHRDVSLWLEARPRLVDELYVDGEDDGHALLWLLPWDGAKESKLPLMVCDPFFIEVCRRIRLVPGADGAPGALSARMAATDDYRLDGSLARGNTGDVWTPIKEDGAALTVGGDGFHYRRLTDLLFSGDYHRPPALEIREQDGAKPWLLAQTMVRGQGQTEGYHHRSVRVSQKVRDLIQARQGRERLGERAEKHVRQAEAAERKVLKPALCALLQKGDEKLDFRDDRPGPWIEAMDREVDAAFFEVLWACVEMDDPAEADRIWPQRLREMGQRQLENAIHAAPIPVAHRPRAIARAELMFQGLARKHLPAAFQEEADQKGDESAERAS